MKLQMNFKIFSLITLVLLTCISCGGGGSSTAAITYSVTYDGNANTGGSVPVAATSYAEGATVTVTGNNNDLTKTGFYFEAWNTQADGEGTSYDGGDVFTMDAADITLYAKWATVYELGDTGPAGGLVFYDKGIVSDGWRFLEAAPSDQSDGITWYNGTNVVTDATLTAVGTGEANTATIVAVQGTGNYAAQLADDLELGGFDDWFLPSADELNLIYTNLASLGLGDFADTVYWSSSETIVDFADCQYLDSGSANDAEKSNTFRVRAVRAF